MGCNGEAHKATEILAMESTGLPYIISFMIKKMERARFLGGGVK
jgi:hypothetical protein